MTSAGDAFLSMADSERLRPFPRRMRSDLGLKRPADDDKQAHPLPIGNRPRQRTSIPRIASLDVIAPAKLGVNKCPSIRPERRPTSPRRLSLSPIEPGDGVFFQERDLNTGHAASLEQMINTLHHVMMTKPVLDPVPIENNSCILRLLEGYRELQEQLRVTEKAWAEEKETKERSLEEFAKVSSEWEKKETDFRAEIKRMELILADIAPGGVGAVALARSGSIVDRSSRSSRLFKARVEQAKSPVKGEESSIAVCPSSLNTDGFRYKARDPDDTAALENTLDSGATGSLRHTHTTYLSMRPNLDSNADAELSERMRKAQLRRFWDTRYDPRKTPGRADLTSCHISNEPTNHQNRCHSTAKSLAKGETTMKNNIVPADDPDSASEVTVLHMNEDVPAGPSDRAVDGRLETTPTQATVNGLLGENPDASTQTGSGLRCKREVSRHKREFSFDPGEDGILLLPLANQNPHGTIEES
ncbi:hypothetical protein CGLO_16040 [Colletotrichum gloeosporioides Cg-14]|uniref:Uncharacterized protein n=1 Tax=Colletotrichum gloeosporioides (strain Cg-14) TaxID=1237896 RepID=T0JPI9_COLGC|nr:hypothetical protein CGLO_16040 [Colletotrichum gloeosporioides Cg-14]